ncbi:MAG TPA: Maf family protein [Anaerolineaceae bacterium]
MHSSMMILASGSPRRRELLALTGWDYSVQPVDLDERPLPGELPRLHVLRLAEQKTLAAARRQPGGVVLGSDTIVVDHDEILGKPRDASDARRMLMQLRGREHLVLTAIGVFDPQTEQVLLDLCSTQVPMRAYTEDEVEKYIASGDPLDKAGAYAIQHPGFHPVDGLDGCYASVMGLPLCHVSRTCRKIGLTTDPNMPQRCQQALGYSCPVYRAVLAGEV